MTLIKGPNGIVFDVADSVASGLIGGGHVVAVESDTEAEEPNEESLESSTEDEDSTTEQAEESEAELEESENDSADVARPAGNASRGDWEAYALAQGFGEEQLADLKQGEIRALFDE